MLRPMAYSKVLLSYSSLAESLLTAFIVACLHSLPTSIANWGYGYIKGKLSFVEYIVFCKIIKLI